MKHTLKLFFCFLFFLLLTFPAHAMQETKQLVTTTTPISIDWLVTGLGIVLLGVKKRKIKRKKQSKVGKWLRKIAGYLCFGIGGIFAAIMFISCLILAAPAYGTNYPHLPFGSVLLVILILFLVAAASFGLANLFFYFGKLLLEEKGDYSIPFPEFKSM